MNTLNPRFIWLNSKAMWDHRQTMSMSRQRLEAEQLRRFRALVAYVKQHSPHYGAIITERGINPTTCVPTDFPVLTKSEMISRFDEIVTDRRITRARIAEFLNHSKDPRDLLDDEFHVLHTSGSSGTVGYYVYSHPEWIRGTTHMIRALPLGWRRKTAYVAATRGHFGGVSLVLTGTQGLNRLFYRVRTYDIGRPTSEIVRGLNEFQPQAVSGYAAILKLLAEAQDRGELRIKPTRIVNGGEPLLSDVKAYIERVFGVRVTNLYVASEHLTMGLTLPGEDGMFLMEDELIFELHDDHVCVTNLFNYTQPLIRYRMNDVLRPDRAAPNRYPLTRVKEVVGRYDDALVFTNRHGEDDFIHPNVIVELLVPGLNAWQIVLLDKTSFRFRARLERDLTPDQRADTFRRIRETMNGILGEKAMDNVQFDIEEVESLAIDPATGKFRMVVRAPVAGQPAPAAMS
jgi:phenylacetate-coenzyme A ligase PaaK-like adenylate-forming protein